MEIKVKETTASCYAELARISKKTIVRMESVVPDTQADIGRILSVRPELTLKSKEKTLRGALVSGELILTVLYVNETEDAVCRLRLSGDFSLDYELPQTTGTASLQAALSVAGVEARALNPRKVSAEAEISCELMVYAQEEALVSSELPEAAACGLHIKTETREVERIAAITEKSFVVADQLSFPEGTPKAGEIFCRELGFQITDREIVGSRLLLKGQLQLRLYLMPQNEPIPFVRDCSVPFSQLIELGTEGVQYVEARIEPASVYLELIDTVDGEQRLEAEVHAVAQICARQRQSVSFLSDAYSNRMPCERNAEELTLVLGSQEQEARLAAEERIELPEDFAALLLLIPTLGPCTPGEGSAGVDLLVLTDASRLFAMHRSFPLKAVGEGLSSAELCWSLSRTDHRISGKELVLELEAKGAGTVRESCRIERVTELTLQEEQAFDTASYPSLTAVWAETESVWELAKLYHSSPEAIGQLNEDLSARPLLIPKTN